MLAADQAMEKECYTCHLIDKTCKSTSLQKDLLSLWGRQRCPAVPHSSEVSATGYLITNLEACRWQTPDDAIIIATRMMQGRHAQPAAGLAGGKRF